MRVLKPKPQLIATHYTEFNGIVCEREKKNERERAQHERRTLNMATRPH